jgi:hypothetical protein
VPAVPLGSDEVVIVISRTEVEIVIVNDLVAFCFGEDESWTFAVNVDEPAAGGTPEMTPLLLKLNPAGNVPEEILQE